MRSSCFSSFDRLALILAGSLYSFSAQADNWEWTIAPYVWGSDTSLDVTINDQATVGGELAFSDLLDSIDLAVQLHAEGRKGRWGTFADVTWIDISEDQTVPATGPFPGNSSVETDFTVGLYELAGFYSLGSDANRFDLLGGARILDYEQEINLATPTPPGQTFASEISENYVDLFVGARYQATLGEHFSLIVRGDVATGDTEFTWNLVGMLAWHLGDTGRYNILAGYRYLDIELEATSNNQKIETEVAMSGPALGFAFNFGGQ